MSFQHGVYIQELDTKILGVRTVDSALPFVVGNVPKGKVDELELIFNYKEAVNAFGNEENYILPRFFKIYFSLYGMAPVVVVPVGHSVSENIGTGDGTTTSFSGTLSNIPIVEGGLSISDGTQVLSDDGNGNLTGDGSGTIDYTTGEYSATFNTAPTSGATISASYKSRTGITSEDIIGGVDATTGKRTGLELIEEVFPRFGKVVGTILCPDFSNDTTVANAMIAKAENINNHFKAMAYIDVPADKAKPADAFSWKQDFGSPHAVIFYPQVKYGDDMHWLASHAAGLTAKVDEKNTGVPFESPSNKELRIDGPAKVFTLQEANYLNEQGIATVFRMMTGWKLWGNRTAAFPENTDIKDTFIPCRRMANWIENNLILLTWQKVDDPMNKRLIETVVSTVNIWLNGLTGRGFLLGAKVYFRPEDNPLTDLANGIIRFYITYLAPPPAETIEYILEVDVAYFNNLFGGE